MRITKEQLKQIIKEEMAIVLHEEQHLPTIEDWVEALWTAWEDPEFDNVSSDEIEEAISMGEHEDFFSDTQMENPEERDSKEESAKAFLLYLQDKEIY